MTVVRVGKRSSFDYMEFAFDDEFSAYVFYSATKDHYREDDLYISMVEEEDDPGLLNELLNKGVMKKMDGKLKKTELTEVCRCKNCNQFKLYEDDGKWHYVCEGFDIDVNGDFYCAHGILNQREDEEEKVF